MQTHGFNRISSGDFLRKVATARGEPLGREALQRLGDALDQDTDFQWVITEVATPAVLTSPSASNWLFDAVRKKRQLEHFRIQFENVFQVHLMAPESVLIERYTARLVSSGTSADYEIGMSEYRSAIAHPNEMEARSLGAFADRVFDTSMATAMEIASEIVMGG
jgi:adenylosuccinate synthase